MISFATVAGRGRGWLPLIGAAALVGTGGALALPTVLGHVVDALVTGGESGRSLALAAMLIVLGVAGELVDAYAGAACVAGTTAWLRARFVRHVLAVGPSPSRRFETGDLVSRVSGSAADAAQAGPTAVTIGAAVLPPLGSIALLAYIDPWLAVSFLAGIGLVVAVLWTFTRNTADVTTAYQRTQGRIAARLTESLAGARTIAAAGTAEQEVRRVLEPLPDLHAQGVRTWRVLARSGGQAALVGPLVLVAVLVAGGIELTHHRISPGELFAASQYAVIGAGLGGLTGIFGELGRARAGVRRLAEVFAVDRRGDGHRALPAGPGRLEFRDVSVYAGGATLLDSVSLVVPGGAAVAVVGHSGAGKSTLAAVAARLRDPDEGEVLLDGVPLDEIDHDGLRAAVGCAFERPVLVGETVGDAVGMGLDAERVEAAARATHAHDFVSRLPRGYGTPLTDAPMSGGEAQRLGLARTWHAERLLVLDDATSSLDMVTEMQITRTLIDGRPDRTRAAGNGTATRTRLIVTHRASTAAWTDLVIWLENGRVRGLDTHDRLWHLPAYRETFG